MLNDQIINEIVKLVREIKRENNIENEIIRDDVFSILQAMDCVVLYYPLEDESIDGCHIEKPMNGELKQFVFINSNNTRERQAFSAAHELGHIWQVDKRLEKKVPGVEFDNEIVVNRFAAEMLMPRKLFEEALTRKLKEMNYQGPSINMADLLRVIAYLMNYFFVPFKSIVIRLNEIGRLKEEDNEKVLVYKNGVFLNEVIKSEQYTRLNIINNNKSMDNLQESLTKIEQAGLFNATKIENIKREFDIKETEPVSDLDVKF